MKITTYSLLGNIAPDINNGYIVEGISHIYDHGHTHLYNPENHSTYTNFYQKYQDILKSKPNSTWIFNSSIYRLFTK